MTHAFTLIVEGPDLQTHHALDALHAAGCDDGTVGSIDGVQFMDFDREADTFLDAVGGAITAVEAAVPGAVVLHVEPDELVTMAEIAERTGRSRESIRLLVSGNRGPGGFPPPATHFRRRHRMWRWPQVARWVADVLGEPAQAGWDGETARLIGAVNAGLAYRNARRTLASAERKQLQRLVR